MGADETLCWPVWRVLRITMGPTIDIQTSQNEDSPSPGLEFQRCRSDLGPLKIEKEPLTSVNLEEVVAFSESRPPKLDLVVRRIKLLRQP
jgi:hypothetical protein